jgi:4-hydroxy-tetrahydrodipicolinate reductase
VTNIRICLAGAAGWAGSALSRGIFEAPDMELVAAVSQSRAGQVLGEAIDIKGLTTPIFATATQALETRPDVFVEFTKPDIARFHILSALRSGAHVVVGTSGLSVGVHRGLDSVMDF